MKKRFVAGKKILRARTVFLLSLIAAGFVVWAVSKETQRNRALEREIAALESEAARIAARNQEMRDLSERLRDAEFLEKEAREKLGFQKPGEIVVMVSGASERAEEAKPKDVNNESNLRKWWRYFLEMKNNE